jgi:hypothetical protein
MTEIVRRNTDQYHVGRFRQHGRTELSFDGTIMRFESSGPFNRELMDAASMAMRDILNELPPVGPWAEIICLRGSALIAPEVLPALQELIESLADDGFASVATAIVAADDVEGISLMIPPYAAVYAAMGRPFNTFESLGDAESWIQDQLAAASQHNP